MTTREHKKAKTRKAILDAAITLFTRKGFDKTSIEELAKEAGIGKGTVYTYFKTKSDILKAFCEDELEFVHAELARKANPDTPFIDQMHTIFFAEFQFIIKNREFGRIFMQELIFPRSSNSIMCGCDEEESDYFALLFPIIEKAKVQGELRHDLDPLYVAGHFYALLLLLVSSYYSERVATMEEAEQGLYTIFQQLLSGLQPPQPQ